MFENEHFGLNFPYAAFRLRTASYPSAGAKKSVQGPKGVRPRTERKVEKRLSYFFLFVYKMEIIIFGMSLSARVDALKDYRVKVKKYSYAKTLVVINHVICGNECIRTNAFKDLDLTKG